MIDEVAEVKQYLDGKWLEDSQNYYRACYMITKYYKKLGLSRDETFLKTAEWVRNYNLTLPFSLSPPSLKTPRKSSRTPRTCSRSGIGGNCISTKSAPPC